MKAVPQSSGDAWWILSRWILSDMRELGALWLGKCKLRCAVLLCISTQASWLGDFQVDLWVWSSLSESSGVWTGTGEKTGQGAGQRAPVLPLQARVSPSGTRGAAFCRASMADLYRDLVHLGNQRFFLPLGETGTLTYWSSLEFLPRTSGFRCFPVLSFYLSYF